MRGKKLSEDFIRLVFEKRSENLSIGDIAKLLNKTKSTIQSILERNNKTSKLGRPRKTTEAVDSKIIVAIKRNRFSSNSSLGKSFHLSKETIRRRALEKGIRSRIAVVDKLTKKHKKERKQWCRGHRTTDFSNYLFTDEVSFELKDCSNAKRAFVHRRVNEKYAPSCVVPFTTQNRARLMFWGAISKYGPGPLACVEGSITADKYISILQEHLQPYLETIPLSRLLKLVFQQDNAPPHKAKKTILALQHLGVKVSTWPALSPDLNVIENVWAILKRSVRKRNPTTLPELRFAVQEEWKKIVTSSLCGRLFDSIRKRINCVLSRGGLR